MLNFSQEAREDNLIGDIHCRMFSIRKMHLTPELWSGIKACSPFWRLYANQQSGAALLTADGRFSLRANHIYLIPAGLSFVTELDGIGVDQLYAHFDLIGISGEMARSLFDCVFEMPDSSITRAFLERDWMSFNGDRAPSVAEVSRMKAVIRYALADWIEVMGERAEKRLSAFLQSNHRIRPVLEYIDAHLGDPLSNTSLAEFCHVGEDHFIRIFKKWTHQTPTQFVLDMRIKRACEMLVLSNQSIETIAAELGFSDRHHLSRAFKARIGQGPATYRKTELVS